MTTPQPRTLEPVLWQSAARPAPAPLRRLFAAVAMLLLALFGLAAALPIESAVIAPGQVVVDTQVKRIAHPVGGVIAQILVRNGQHVVAGQALLRLDSRVSGADARLSERGYEQLLAQKARLDAEQSGGTAIAFPAELAASHAPEATTAMADERRLFAVHQNEAGAMHAQLIARIAQENAAIAGFAAQIAATREQLRLIEREREGLRELWQRQLVTASRMYQLDRTAADLAGTIGSLQAQIAQARARMAEAREQAIQLGQTRRVEAGNALGPLQAALNQQDLHRLAANDGHDHDTIRAAYAGTVEKLAFAAVGDVIRPGEPIAEIVPDRAALVIEAMIGPGDIDHVRTGAPARVRFPGFNRATSPDIPGTVIYLASDRSENTETRQAFYVARIALAPDSAPRARLDLRNGMPAEVHVAGRSRTMLSYVFKPLRDQFARAFRDD